MARIERVYATGNSFTDDLLTANRWAETTISYSFATSPASFGSGYGRGEANSGFQAFTPQQQAAATAAFAAWSSVANIDFVQTSTADAVIRLASSSLPRTAWAYSPSAAEFGGDVWIGTASFNGNPSPGNYAFMTVMHEIGHALGLGHPHSPTLSGNNGAAIGGAEDALCPCCAGVLHGQVTDLAAAATTASTMIQALDAMPYSVMSYRSFEGAVIANGYQNEAFGYAQTPMVRDIAAIQHLYGANYETNSGNTVYRWSDRTGERSENGVGQGAPGMNRVFETVWDGNGVDTFDLSNYKTDLVVDLNPGGWTNFDNSQISRLGAGEMAPGNVALALLHQGDVRALIENVVGGSGDDILLGNVANNVILGGAGDDQIFGGNGQNILVGGYLGNELSLVNTTAAGLAGVSLAHVSSDGDDLLVGGDHNDIFVSGTGENEVHGQGGADTLIFALAWDELTIVENADDSLTITYQGGSVLAHSVEYIAATDGIFSFGALQSSPLADDVVLLYSAGLGRDIDAAGLNYWLTNLNDGGNLTHIASSIMASQEFATRFGEPASLDDGEFIEVLYNNILGRDGEDAGIAYWTGALVAGTSRADVLLSFASGAENTASVAAAQITDVGVVKIDEVQWQLLTA